ncbi:MAG: hypothetical protein INQ03_05315 [Candidatus Heimdallarchaeota archaeon]|nr:hypothetical protein [Candidatus Heimdallarchaeota archaeon]
MRKVISTDKAPPALGPYSQGIVVGNLLFTSGQVGIDPDTKQMKNETLLEEVTQIMNNLTSVAIAAGTSLENVVKTTIFLTDLGNFAEVNELYGSYFKSDPPARSTVEVSKLPAAANVEIEMIIAIP